jgi:hypothetical protein
VIGRAKFNVLAARAEELVEDRPELVGKALKIQRGCKSLSAGPRWPGVSGCVVKWCLPLIVGGEALPEDEVDVVVHLKTAEALSLAIPEAFLSLADEVLE